MKSVVLLICTVMVLFAGDLEKGMEAVEKGDFKTAFEAFKRAAEAGDPIAQQNLGVLYNNGYGVKKDREMASYWFDRASKALTGEQSPTMTAISY
ncbi:MAG: hypothetical protein B6D59_02985 [Campylobacteraceae bacterium 4484_4]|nr:MAG: hypothetical protein B6D59_02985 [Campylobacteraceae bacterium 4484_4]